MFITKTKFIIVLFISCNLYSAIINASEIKQPTVGGTIQVDTAFINDDKAELIPGSGTEVRRARFFITGLHEKIWEYKLRVGFEENDLSVKDAYLFHTSTNIKIGLFKPSFSIDEMTSSKYITFMEQALPNAFKPGRRIGISHKQFSHNTNFNFSMFGQGSNEGDNGDEGFGISSRITSPVLQSDTRVLHLGINLSYEQPEDDVNNSISFDAQPESHITGNIVDTGNINNVKTIFRSGLELSSVFQSFSIQAEVILVTLNKNDNSSDLQFSGSYLYGSWFLTGEHRPYKSENGVYGRIKPINSNGAVELALRISTIDLNDDTITGGKATNVTAGMNWYSTLKTRFSVNYIHVTTDNNTNFGNPDILQARAQIDF